MSKLINLNPTTLKFQTGGHHYKLLVYIQFDKWVQQIIDEQIHVQCTIDGGEKQIKTEHKNVNVKVTIKNKGKRVYIIA